MDSSESQKQKAERAYYWLALRIAGDFGVSIAVPALIGAYVGQKLDNHFGTEPRILALCLIIALLLTAIIVVRKAKYYATIYQNIEK